MKMLEDPEYVLCEIHEFGERRLGTEEKPLLGRTRLVVDRDKPGRNSALELWSGYDSGLPLGPYLHNILLEHGRLPYQILVTAHRPNSPFPLDLTGRLGLGLALGLGLINNSIYRMVWY